jgi:hypothetical protein
MDPTASVHQILCKSRRIVTEALAIIKHVFGEESMSRTRVFEWHSRFRTDQKSHAIEKQSQEHTLNFLWHHGDCSQTILPGRSNSPVTFYGDCVNMCEDFAPNFGNKGTGCCIMTAHRFTLPFSPGNY